MDGCSSLSDRQGDQSAFEVVDDVDQILAEEIRRVCATARSLIEDDRFPTVQLRTLKRDGHRLVEAEREAVDWRFAFPVLTRQGGFWEHLATLIEPLCADPLIDTLTGWLPQAPHRAEAIWRDVLKGLIERCRETSGGWEDDPELVARMIAEWRAAYDWQTVPMQTLVPLDNLQGPEETLEIEAGVRLRSLTDEERAEFWEKFADDPALTGVTIEQLNQWSHALDLRWEMVRRSPADYSPVDEKIIDVVRAMRLHHPGQVGYALTWTRIDPADWPGSGPWVRDRLTTSRSGSSFGVMGSSVEAQSVEKIRRLLAALRATKGDKALSIALRRFDQASGREDDEDTLIDLWIAFEALLLPDGSTELNYRVALRLARLCGDTPEQREDIFSSAKESYRARSKIVHGESPPEAMPQILSRTRDIAREAVSRWLLHRPADGVKGLDRALLS